MSGVLTAIKFIPKKLLSRRQRLRLRGIHKNLRLSLRLIRISLLGDEQNRSIKQASEQLSFELRIAETHRNYSKKAALIRKKGILKLELGGGASVRPGWINIDLLAPDPGLRLDLREPLPFSDNSVDAIYTSHALEHFSYPDPLRHILAECFRVLNVGGEFSIAVPDFGKAFRNYAVGEAQFYRGKYWGSPAPNWCKTPMDHLNWLVYMGGEHKQLYDEVNLQSLLLEAGFESVAVRDFDPELDEASRKHQSIYVLARKTSSRPLLLDQGHLCRENNSASYDALWKNPLYTHRYVDGDRIELWWHIAFKLGSIGRILDLGSGGGHLLSIIKRGLNWPAEMINGLDYSPQATRASLLQVPGSLQINGDAYHLPYPNATFDYVLSCETFEHLPKPDLVLAEAMRVLKQDGTLVISVPNGDVDDYEGHCNFWNMEQFQRFCSDYSLCSSEKILNDTTLVFTLKKR